MKICTPELEVSKTPQISKGNTDRLQNPKSWYLLNCDITLQSIFLNLVCLQCRSQATVVRLLAQNWSKLLLKAAAELICLHCTMLAQAKDINLQQPFFTRRLVLKPTYICVSKVLHTHRGNHSRYMHTLGSLLFPYQESWERDEHWDVLKCKAVRKKSDIVTTLVNVIVVCGMSWSINYLPPRQHPDKEFCSTVAI